MRRFYLGVLLCCTVIVARAQTATNYVFSQTTTTYTTETGLTNLQAAGWDDGSVNGIALPFSFWYCGSIHNTFGVNNGYVQLSGTGITASSTYTPVSANGMRLSIMGEDLQSDPAFTPRTVDYTTIGTTPNRRFCVQWQNARHWNNATGGPLNFKINLYESSHVVEFVYGNCTPTSATTYTPQVGINGPTTANFNNRTTTSNWNATTAGGANNATCTRNNSVGPTNGLTFRWTPPPTVSVNPATVGQFTTNTSTTSTAQTFTVTAWGLTSGSVTITAPANFEIFNGSAWVSSMTVNAVAAAVGTYVKQAIQVRFVAPASPGTYTGNITCASTGATTQNVAVSGLAVLVCSGVPAPGTVTASTTSGACNPYSTNLSLPATSGIGALQFQWESSPDGSAWNPVAGATNSIYSPSISANIYYRANVTCQVSGLSAPTPGVLFSYTPPPTAITGSGTVCQFQTSTLASTPSGGTFSSSNGSIATINPSTGVVTGVAPGTANIVYTGAASCTVSRTITVNQAPTINVTPATSTVCSGTASTLNAVAAAAGSSAVPSGAISINVPDSNPAGITATLPVSLPPGAVVTGVAVNMNMTHTWIGDMIINLKAPNGNILNLMNQHGGSADNLVNTTISSNGTVLVSSGTAPFTGTYLPTGASAVGATGFLSNVTNFSGLYSVPNGNWQLVMRDAAGGDLGVLTSWTLTLSYTLPPTTTWAPFTGLFTDAALTTPYTGAGALTIYAAPTAGTTYTATATGGSCTSTALATVNVNPLPDAITGPGTVCETRNITLANTTSGGTWTSSNTTVATINSSTGVLTGGIAGTTLVSYTLTSTGCRSTKVVTVMPTPPAITTTTSFGVCEAGTINLTNPDGGTGTWTSADPGNATVGLTSGVVTGVASGMATISYTALNTCVTTRQVTVNPLPVPTVTPPSATLCIGNGTTITVSSPAPQMTLLNQDFNGALTGWTVVNVGTPATTEPWQISPSGGLTGAVGDGSPYLQAYSQGAALPVQTTITSPSFNTTGGFGNVTLTFNQTLLSFAPPDVTASVEISINGGAWSSLVPNQAGGVLNAGGTWAASTPEVTVDLPPAAIGVNDVRLRWVYNGQSLYWLVDNISVKGTMPASSFSWSGPAGLSCTNCASPTITPAVAGTNVYNAATTTSAGCVVNTPVTITVNDLPAPIGGGLTVCEGVTNMLTSGPGSGTWSVGTPSVATIVSGTGAITGVATGTTPVTFTQTSTGCSRTGNATVLTAPAANSITSVALCNANSVTLSNPSGGGAWSSSNSAIASVTSGGVVTAVSGGVANITYTISSGCIALTAVTVNTPPSAIMGSSSVCQDATTVFTNMDGFGSWSSNNTAIASVNPSTGDVLGVNAGNTFITYTLPSGCYTVKPILVSAIPNATGPSAVCQGQTALFSGTSVGATWSSTAPAVASISTSGVVTTNSTFSGSLNILYTFTSSGCSRVMPFTVNTKAPITGPTAVCEAASTILSNIVPGGTWASANDLIAAIDPVTGTVTGMNAMATFISYTTPAGCTSTRTIVVNALPGVIAGPATVCENGVTSVSNTTPLGIWSSSNPSVATINSIGEVTAMTNSGNTTITYQLISTGCRRTHDMAVVPLPDAISGTAAACANGGTTMLSSTSAGGAWSSSNSIIAAIGSNTGVVTGNLAGSVIVTYMLPTGCFRTQIVAVNPLPNSITGTATVCEGLNTDLNNTTTGGTWTSQDGGIATVDPVTGLVHGEEAGVTGIVYTLGTGCSRTRMVTVNVVPEAFTGNLAACVGQTSALATTPTGGVWSVGSSAIATVSSLGIVNAQAAGATNVSYTLPTGCRMVSQFTVNALPTNIIGTRAVCIGNATTLSNGVAGGTWAVTDVAMASVDMTTGVVNGITDGVTSITYELPTGCKRIANLTVNPLPAAITGSTSVCQNSTTTLTSATPGGTWTSANNTIATIGAATGIATGIAEGVVNISYTLPTGCRATTAIEVQPLPADITGADVVCENATTVLGNVTVGGNWSVDNGALANVDVTGTVTGIAQGTVVVKYTLPTSCYKTKAMLVNPLPAAIVGAPALCQGSTTTLSSATPGGVWSSSNTVIAPIHPSGLVSGNAAGFAVINYTLPTGCARNTTVVVNALPEPITGNAAVCVGDQTTLESASPNGVWNSGNPGATITSTGVVTAIATGTTMISYTNANGCRRMVVLTMNALPGLITGDAAICPGTTATLGNAAMGGTWSTDNASMVNIHATSGVATATGADGVANITYTLPTGCMRAKEIMVHPAVNPVTGASTICKGSNTTLANTTPGGMWTSANAATATVDASGMVTGNGAGVTTIAYVMPTGCKAVQTMIVNPIPNNITGAGAVCEGSSIALSNTFAGGAWSISAGTAATIAASGMLSGVEAGNVTVKYELPTGCFVTRDVVVNALPEAQNVTGGGAYCAGGTGVVIGVDNTQAGMLYKLMLGTTPVITTVGGGSAISYGNQLTAGTYIVTAVSPQGCMRDMTGSAEVVINPLVTPTVALTSDHGASACAGTAVTYTATGTNGGTTPTYEWRVNGSVVGTSSTYSFVPANGDNVSVKFISSDACPAPASVTAAMSMEVFANLTPAVTIAVGPDDSVCQGSTAIFAAAAVNGGTAPVYAWVVNGNVVPGATTSVYNYQPNNNDLVVARLTSNYACATTNNVSSNSVKMHVDAVFTPVVDMTANPGVKVQEGTEVTFTATPLNAGDAPAFQWLINQSAVAGATLPVFKTADLVDGDSVTCIVYGNAKCANLSINSIVMEITPAPTSVTNTVIGNNEVRLIPNPNTGTFTVTGTLASKADESVTLEVTDMLGQVIYRGTSVARNGVVNERVELGKTLANGMYMLSMGVGAERRAFHFVVKQ